MDQVTVRMFRNEQRRHRDAVTNTVESMGAQAERIAADHAAGRSVTHELRNLLADVTRAFERATALDALNEVAWAFEQSDPA